jgi:hypothetical protein
MATSNSDGSQTAVISTEHTLATITTSGSFVLAVDANNMALGDELILRVKLKVRSVGTTRLAYEVVYANIPNEPVLISIPVASTNEIVFTLEQTAGTGRTYPWEIWEL